MPTEQENFQKAVADILEAVIFENWLRFYFIKENAPQGSLNDSSLSGEQILTIDIPEKSMAKIAELFPRMLPMAESMNHKPIDFETSRRAVLTFVLDNVDGKELPRGMAQTVFSSATFQAKLQLFNTWVQMHEEQLDGGFLDFGKWRGLFARWLESPVARELGQKLMGHAPADKEGNTAKA